MATPPSPGNTLADLLTSDTFRTWFDRSNQIIGFVNPIEVYGLTNDVLLPGITFSVDSDGIANLGFPYRDTSLAILSLVVVLPLKVI